MFKSIPTILYACTKKVWKLIECTTYIIKLDESDMQDTTGETGDELIRDVLLWTPTHGLLQKQDDQHEHTFSSCARIRDAVLRTCLGRWTIGRSGERGSGISVLPARHDDDDDDIIKSYWQYGGPLNCIQCAHRTNVQKLLFGEATMARLCVFVHRRTYLWVRSNFSTNASHCHSQMAY